MVMSVSLGFLHFAVIHFVILNSGRKTGKGLQQSAYFFILTLWLILI